MTLFQEALCQWLGHSEVTDSGLWMAHVAFLQNLHPQHQIQYQNQGFLLKGNGNVGL